MVWKRVGCIINSYRAKVLIRILFVLVTRGQIMQAMHHGGTVQDNTAAKAVLYFTYSSIAQGYTFFA